MGSTLLHSAPADLQTCSRGSGYLGGSLESWLECVWQLHAFGLGFNFALGLGLGLDWVWVFSDFDFDFDFRDRSSWFNYGVAFLRCVASAVSRPDNSMWLNLESPPRGRETSVCPGRCVSTYTTSKWNLVLYYTNASHYRTRLARLPVTFLTFYTFINPLNIYTGSTFAHTALI